MNRAWPIALLALVFLYLGANVSSAVLWSITGVAVLMLIGLMFFMWQRGQFIGPGTLVDDVRSMRDRFIEDDDEDVEIVEVAVRRRRAADIDEQA